MAPAAEVLREGILQNLFFADPSVPVVMNVDAEGETAPEQMKQSCLRAWRRSIGRNPLKMQEQGVDPFVEIGPGKPFLDL